MYAVKSLVCIFTPSGWFLHHSSFFIMMTLVLFLSIINLVHCHTLELLGVLLHVLLVSIPCKLNFMNNVDIIIHIVFVRELILATSHLILGSTCCYLFHT